MIWLTLAGTIGLFYLTRNDFGLGEVISSSKNSSRRVLLFFGIEKVILLYELSLFCCLFDRIFYRLAQFIEHRLIGLYRS